MTIDLEERIRRAAQLLDGEVGRANGALPPTRPTSRHVERRRSAVVSVAAVSILVVGLFGVFLLAGRNPSSVPATDELPSIDRPSASSTVTSPSATTTPLVPPATTTPPAATLPTLVDVSVVVPATVLGTGPTDWYRLQPDLDVAWYGDGRDQSMLCFRTPAGQECQVDEFAPTEFGGGPIGVRSVDDQLLVLTLDPATSVTIAFDGGQTLTVPVEEETQTGWAVARVQMPPGATAQGLSMLFAMTQDRSAVPVATAPATEPVATVAG